MKIKFKEIDKRYEEWLDKIVLFLENTKELNEENLFKLHNIFFPKNILGETIDDTGKMYYINYKAGEYRKVEDFVIFNDTKRYYIPFKKIDASMKSLISWFDNDLETEIYKKIIIFYIYFLEIHPFSNGNGTIALLFMEKYLYENDIKFSLVDFLNTLNIDQQLLFFKEGFSGNYQKSFDIINQQTS